MPFAILQVSLIIVLPYLLARLTQRWGTQDWLSPVVLCYVAGIGLRNLTPYPLDDRLSMNFSHGSILLALPLLLYSTDFKAWILLARTTILSFLLMIAGVLASVTISTWLFADLLTQPWSLAGMLAGVFIGGTPNMNAIGIALEVGDETFIKLNAAEIACGGVYLIFLTSVAHRFFGLFLPDFKGDKHTGENEFLPRNGYGWQNILIAFGLTLLLAGLAVAIVKWTTGTLDKPGLVILLVSAFGVGASFVKKIRNLPGAYESGEYLLLMFCIAIGMMADFSEIISDGWLLIGFCALVLVLAVSFHALLCRLFGIDRDTMIITSTAGLYGPPFIGQVAAVIKNRSLVFSGIVTGLVGIALANFIGVALANLLEKWIMYNG